MNIHLWAIDKYAQMIGRTMEGYGKTFLILASILFLITPSLMVHGEEDPIKSTRTLTPIDDPEMHPLGFFRGILPNPHPGEDILTTYQNASKHSQFVPVWGRPSPFYNLSTDLNGAWGDLFVDALIRENGMFPLVHMSFFKENMEIASPPSIKDPSLNNTEWRLLYKHSALDVVNATRPKYLSLGNEVNRWLDHHGDDPSNENAFRHFISLYNETYDAVKQISPETIVFCTFAREMVIDNQAADMSFLERFDADRLDLMIMTTYPHSVQGINRVSDIPTDYYSSVFQYTGEKKMGFSEAAWPSLTAFGGEAEQVAFIDNITGRLTEELDMELLGWPWLNDIGPTDATGLRYNDGTEKAGLMKWRMNIEPTFNRSNRIIDIMEDSGTTTYDLMNTFSDPDEWDVLSFGVWNGSDYSDSYDNERITARINGTDLIIQTKENKTGNTQLQVQATDIARDTNWTVLLVRVENINDPPALIEPDTRLILNEGATPYVDLSSIITDAEDPLVHLNFNITESPSLAYDLITFPDPFMYIRSEDPDWFGSTYIGMLVTDRDGAIAPMTISVDILPIDDPPVLNITKSIKMVEDTPLLVIATGWWMDPDPGDELNVTVIPEEDPKVDVIIRGEQISLNPHEDWYGTTHFTINVTDGTYFETETVEVTVSPVNDAPRCLYSGSGRNKTVNIVLIEDTEARFILNDLISPYDPEGEVIIYTLKNGSDLIRTVSFNNNGTMVVVPTQDSNGEGLFRISMRDPSGGENIVSFSFEIVPVNDPPFFMTPKNWSVSLKRGDHYEIDLAGEPYIAEDVEESLDDLNIHISSDLCKREDNLIIIEIPIDFDSEKETVSFYLEDQERRRSEIRYLTINVIDPVPADGSLSLSYLNITYEEGSLVVIAEGLAYQEIWVMVSPDRSELVFKRIHEDPNAGSGKYYLRWDGLDEYLGDSWSFSVFLSSEMKGPRNSGFEPWKYTLSETKDEPTSYEKEFPYEAFSLTALVILIVVIFAVYMKRKNQPFQEE